MPAVLSEGGFLTGPRKRNRGIGTGLGSQALVAGAARPSAERNVSGIQLEARKAQAKSGGIAPITPPSSSPSPAARARPEDPMTWTRSWTARIPMTRTDAPLFEYACHEGNYAMTNILAGARAKESAAADTARPR